MTKRRIMVSKATNKREVNAVSEKRKVVESTSKKFTGLPDNQKYYVLGFIHREELDKLTKKEKQSLGLSNDTENKSMTKAPSF